MTENQENSEKIDDRKQPSQEAPKPEDELMECRDRYVRLLADMENLRKRNHKDKQEAIRFAQEDLLQEFLAPIDTLENALKFADKMSEETRSWALGFRMILNQFKEILESQGVAPFSSAGTLFDPHQHEAVEIEETESHPEGTVLHEFSKGYKMGSRILRASRVKVAKTPREETAEIEENKS